MSKEPSTPVPYPTRRIRPAALALTLCATACASTTEDTGEDADGQTDDGLTDGTTVPGSGGETGTDGDTGGCIPSCEVPAAECGLNSDSCGNTFACDGCVNGIACTPGACDP